MEKRWTGVMGAVTEEEGMMEEGVVMMVEEEVTSKRAEQWRTERTMTKRGVGVNGGRRGDDRLESFER